MTNVWTKSVKQVELWLSSNSLSMTLGSGIFSFVGSAINLIPLFINLGSGTFNETGSSVNLVVSGGGGGPTAGSPVGLLLAITYPGSGSTTTGSPVGLLLSLTYP